MNWISLNLSCLLSAFISFMIPPPALERKEKETEEDWSSDTPCEVGDQMGDRQVQAAAVFRSYGLYLVMGYT